MPLEPVPETDRALAGLADVVDRPLGAELVRKAAWSRRSCQASLGLSVATVRTADFHVPPRWIALLDAVQYVFGGPCVDAALQGSTVHGGDNDEGLLNEQRWAEFARASAARGVMSTLSLRVQEDGRVVAASTCTRPRLTRSAAKSLG